MSAPSSPCVLIVADPGRIAELASALEEPLPQGEIDVATSTGGDDTLDLFESHHPEVVVVTASLEVGDSRALVEALRAGRPRGEVAIVVVGDDTGPIRTALDASELAPERFITRPLSAKALRFAVAGCLDAVTLVRGPAPIAPPSATTLTRANGRPSHVDDDPTAAAGTRAALRARWEALADSIGGDDELEDDDDLAAEPAPLPPPLTIQPRKRTQPGVPVAPWQPNTTDPIRVEPAPIPEAPTREPTLIIADVPPRSREPSEPPDNEPVRSRTTSDPPKNVVMLERGEPDEHWSEPMALAELADRDSGKDFVHDELDHFDDDIVVGQAPHVGAAPLLLRGGQLEVEGIAVPGADPAPPAEERAPTRDFARQLRAKMSMMAQRLFQADSQPAVDLGPRHDHHTEIDLAALAEEPRLGQVTEIKRELDARELTTSPGSWDTQVRERGLPDSGEIVRGVSDAAMLLARMFAQAATGRIGFRRDDPDAGNIEKVVFFDQGRPVFASSNEPGDRMGELLVREGKITAAQYERCQSLVAESGRRMGEILVDFGYLKRRELLPAVRRHVEDIVYSLFGWDAGHYHITIDTMPSAERIRLSRHPASLILEGIRRKLDRTTLEKLVGAASTVIEVPDRERLGGILNSGNSGNSGDLGPEERAALAAFDGQADLAQVARAAGVDVADLLPLAWGLCVLGLATARRTEPETTDETSALVGETDLVIDRERVRARWQLVTEADYFALLGVRRDATAFEIRRAYQSARRDFAADCFPNDLRRELARELDDIANVLDEAFRVLRDDRLRMTYLTNLIE